MATSINAPSISLKRPPEAGLHQNKFRNARFQRFLKIVDEVAAKQSVVRIVDLGGIAEYWTTQPELWQGRNIHVTLVNLLETHTPDERFTSIVGSACETGLADNSFDIVHSNSVIEHVGRWKEMKAMANEVRRLAPRYYVQTPNYWFPLEAHSRFPLFNILPEPWRIHVLRRLGAGYYAKSKTMDEAMEHMENAILLDFRRFQALFPDARLERERLYGLTKSLMAIR